MSKFKNKKSIALPAISTASLPDIVFMLLFFFMVATVMRQNSLLIHNELPIANQVEQLDQKDLVMYIHAGQPSSRYQKNAGDAPRIQLNDKFASIEEIKAFVLAERAATREALIPFMTTALKIDKNVHMGLIDDIKKELRIVNALKINYTTRQGDALEN